LRLKRVPRGSTGQQIAAFETTPAETCPYQNEVGGQTPVSPPQAPRARAPSLQPTVILFGRLGDMVMVSSVLHPLHLRFQQPCLILGAGEWNAPLFSAQPDVAEVWSLPRHVPFFLSPVFWRALWSLRRCHPGPIYVCERQPRQLARVRRLLRLSGIDPARCLFITDLAASHEEHWVDRFVRFSAGTPAALRASDYPLPRLQDVPAPVLCVTDSERTERDAWIRSQGWDGRPLILVQPGNRRSMSKRRERRQLNADDKLWPTERWASLLERIQGRMPEALILLCGTAREEALLGEIRAAARRAGVVEAKLPLRPLLALCEVAHSMISVDTGPAHAAAALGLPLVVLFGAESPRRWLPRSALGSAVMGVGGPPERVRADQISVEDVFSIWCELLAKKAAPYRHPARTYEGA